MIRYLAQRVALAIPTLLAVTLLTTVLIRLAPGDVAITILGSNATVESLADLRAELGLSEPWYQQWWRYVAGLLTGDLGTSVLSDTPVIELLNDRLPVTFSVMVVSTLVGTIVGVLFGTVSALRGGWLGKALDLVAMMGMAVPAYWFALILVSVFAVQLRLFPAIGYVPIAESPALWATHLTLPVIALAFSKVAIVGRTTRDSVLEVRAQSFVRVMRANGIREGALLWKHVSKNAAAPILTVVSLIFIASATGAVFIENVFGLPGLGSLATDATAKGDLPIVQGVAVYLTVIVLVVNLLVDLAYVALNPKVRIA